MSFKRFTNEGKYGASGGKSKSSKVYKDFVKLDNYEEGDVVDNRRRDITLEEDIEIEEKRRIKMNAKPPSKDKIRSVREQVTLLASKSSRKKEKSKSTILSSSVSPTYDSGDDEASSSSSSSYACSSSSSSSSSSHRKSNTTAVKSHTLDLIRETMSQPSVEKNYKSGERGYFEGGDISKYTNERKSIFILKGTLKTRRICYPEFVKRQCSHFTRRLSQRRGYELHLKHIKHRKYIPCGGTLWDHFLQIRERVLLEKFCAETFLMDAFSVLKTSMNMLPRDLSELPLLKSRAQNTSAISKQKEHSSVPDISYYVEQYYSKEMQRFAYMDFDSSFLTFPSRTQVDCRFKAFWIIKSGKGQSKGTRLLLYLVIDSLFKSLLDFYVLDVLDEDIFQSDLPTG